MKNFQHDNLSYENFIARKFPDLHFKAAYMCIPNVIEEDGWYHQNNASNTEVHCGVGMGKPLEYSTAGIIK